MVIYKNFDRKFTLQLENSVERKIEATVSISETEKGIVITAIDEDRIKVSIPISIDKMEESQQS